MKLYITQSKLRSIDNIGALKMLGGLDISNTLIQKLPDSIGSLENLKVLSVYGNRIRKLPEAITRLKTLESIYANRNALSELPKNIGNMRMLKTIDVRNNYLRELPASTSNLKNVVDFYVSSNPLCPDYQFPSNLLKAEGLCEEQCSPACLNKWRRDHYCDDDEGAFEFSDHLVPPRANSGCNVVECNYDDGDCAK